MTQICVDNTNIIGSDNGLSPERRQAINWTNVGILSIGPLGTNFNENLIEIDISSSKKMHLKMSSGKWRPFCLGLSVLIKSYVSSHIQIYKITDFKVYANLWNAKFSSAYRSQVGAYSWNHKYVSEADPQFTCTVDSKNYTHVSYIVMICCGYDCLNASCRSKYLRQG